MSVSTIWSKVINHRSPRRRADCLGTHWYLYVRWTMHDPALEVAEVRAVFLRTICANTLRR
ncbi:hypothetical protein BH24CHL2_BH24CHL2_7900 [soil metagenome]